MTRAPLVFPLLAAGLAGCAEDPSFTVARTPTTVVYAPSVGDLPVPSDLLFSGSIDGTLNFDDIVADPADFSDPQVALSALDGWSTNAAFRVSFSSAVDAGSLTVGQTVRLFEVTADTSVVPVGGPVTGVVGEVLGFTVGLADEDASGQTIAVTLTEPLKAATPYMLVITTGVRDAEGFAMAPSRDFTLAATTTPWGAGTSLAALQGVVGPMLDAAATQGISRGDVVLANGFTTQGIADVIGTLQLVTSGAEATVLAGLCNAGYSDACTDVPDPRSTPVLDSAYLSLGTTGAFGGGGIADVFQGSLTLPYYLDAASNGSATGTSFDAAPLSGFWNSRYTLSPADTDRNVTRFNTLPEITSQQTVPILITLPNAGSGQTQPAGGWPVVVFQHGIGQERSNLIAIADRFAQEGLAAVAIDLPLHGITDTASPLFTSHLDGGQRERSFGLDLVDNVTGAPGPDGNIDASGTHYINLVNLLVTRDNLRQAHADILNLISVLGAVDTDSDTNADLDPAEWRFVGYSLGGIVGMGAMALVDPTVSKSFVMPGGGLPKMLVDSPAYSAQILGGLASVGVLPGTADFESFLFAAQTVTDAGDPINFAAAYSNPAQRVHLIEVVGDGASNLPDQVVLNSVDGAPLSGTEPLIATAALAGTSVTLSDPGGVRGAVRFTEGSHSSLLSPASSNAAWAEMQTQVARFAATQGTELPITDMSVIQ